MIELHFRTRICKLTQKVEGVLNMLISLIMYICPRKKVENWQMITKEGNWLKVELPQGSGNEFILYKEKFLETNEFRLPNLEREEKLLCLYERASKRNMVCFLFYTIATKNEIEEL